MIECNDIKQIQVVSVVIKNIWAQFGAVSKWEIKGHLRGHFEQMTMLNQI